MSHPDVVVDRARLWARAELLRESVRAVARALEDTEAELIVMKGLHLAYAVAEHPSYRSFADADVVLTGTSYTRALQTLAARGWEIRHDDWSTSTVFDDANRTVDLHRRPLPAFFGRLDARALRRRATKSDALFGPRVWVPDPVDAACIAIAHYLKDKIGVFGNRSLGIDLALLQRRAGVTPVETARRLTEHGLRRSGMIALCALSSDDRSFVPWFEALAPSRIERMWATRMVTAMRGRWAGSQAALFLLVRTIGDDPQAMAANAAGAMVRLPWILLERVARRYPGIRYARGRDVMRE